MNAGGQGGYVQLDRWHPLVFTQATGRAFRRPSGDGYLPLR